MKIPRYWARGTVQNNGDEISAWGWSNESHADAEANACRRAERIATLLGDPNADRDAMRRGQEYEYAAYPMREQVVETHKADDGKIIAAVTRNRYGSLVLNTAGVCFVDIDFESSVSAPDGASVWEKIRRMFSASARVEAAELHKNNVMESVRNWAQANPRQSFRLYRTAAGLRLLFTDRTYDPKSQEVARLFDELGSDRLYRALTLKQECFRARLTPKPWRCGVKELHRDGIESRWPEEEMKEVSEWIAGYEAAIAGFGVCELAETFGQASGNAEVSRVMAIHDRYVLGKAGLPLA